MALVAKHVMHELRTRRNRRNHPFSAAQIPTFSPRLVQTSASGERERERESEKEREREREKERNEDGRVRELQAI